MNSLPLISHHLFAAAVGNDGPAVPRPGRKQQPAPITIKGIVTELPFELLEAVTPPEPATAEARWMRTEAAGGNA